MKKFLFAPLLLSCIAYAATEEITEIPEGKIIDYPSIYHDVTPSAGPRVINGIGMFATGDYTYWTAREDNIQFASTGYTNDNEISVAHGSGQHVKFKFHSGFKAGLGFSFGHDYWDTLFNYTWYQSNNNKGSLTVDETAGLIPTFSPYINLTEDDYFTSASSLWTLHFNVVDWELGRNFYISKYLSLRPFIGLKGTWQKQRMNLQYTGIQDNEDFSYQNNLKQKFWGIGIRSGCNTAWHLAGTWSIFGDIAISTLWGQFTNYRTDTVTREIGTVTPVSQENQIHNLTPVLELAIGLRKEQWFYHNRLHFSAQGGWEEQFWWDQNQFSWTRSIPLGGNLTLQGLTAKLRLDF